MEAQIRRREFMAAGVALGAGYTVIRGQPPAGKPAQIAITLDLEMCAQYPRRELMEWNYQKGNLDEPTKRYAVEAARIVKQAGGVLHFFCVGQVLEQENIDWLAGLAAAGHPIGNHTYDHVNVKATKAEDTQFRFQRAPWLVRGQTAEQVIRENIRRTTIGLKQRAGITVNGFRTPGGFYNGLEDRPDIQRLLLDEGFRWVSAKYPAHAQTQPGQEPDDKILASIVAAQQAAQPMVYPSGLIEIPMSPISDVTAFRTGRWRLPWFLRAIRGALAAVLATGGVFDLLAHPSCLVVEDPDFTIIKLVIGMTRQAGDRAALVGLDRIAERLRPRQ